MKKPARINRKDYPIPNVINLLLFFVSIFSCIGILKWTSLQESLWLIMLGVISFSFINNTCFSLLHEATHGQLNSNRSINNLMGRIIATLFPTSFSLQQLYHLGHHRRNRTDAEMFDLYYPGDNLIIKKIIIYGTVGGIYWMTPFISCILFFVNPNWILSPDVKDSKFLSALSANHMLGGLESALARKWVVRGEILLIFLVQFLIIYVVGVSWSVWLLSYWAFGINWGSLQYADHVGSKRDIVNGAWNLKVPFVIQWLYLHYHIHLVHHRYPNLPWIHLPKLQDPEDEFPNFSTKLWEFITGPRPATERSPSTVKELDGVLFEGTRLE